MKKKYEIVRISGVAMGVGFSKESNGGNYSETICSTLFDTGNDKRDALESEKWAKVICDALNEYFNK